MGTKVLTLKQALHEPISGGTDHHGVGLSEPLYPRGDIRSVTQGELFSLTASPHLAYDYQAGVNADAHRKGAVCCAPPIVPRSCSL